MIQCILAFLLCFSCQINAQKVKNDEVYTLAISYEKSGDAKNAARLYQELYAKDNTNIMISPIIKIITCILKVICIFALAICK